MKRLDNLKKFLFSSVSYFISVIIFLCLSFVTTASETGDNSSQQYKSPSKFALTIEQQHISLKATNASLKKIVEQIGNEFNVQVDAYIDDDARVTTEFEKLPLEVVIKQLSQDYAYFTDEKDKKITKIIFYPKDEEAPVLISQPQRQTEAAAGETHQPVRSQDVDISKFSKNEQDGDSSNEIKVAQKKKEKNKKSSQVKPFEFEFDPAAVLNKE